MVASSSLCLCLGIRIKDRSRLAKQVFLWGHLNSFSSPRASHSGCLCWQPDTSNNFSTCPTVFSSRLTSMYPWGCDLVSNSFSTSLVCLHWSQCLQCVFTASCTFCHSTSVKLITPSTCSDSWTTSAVLLTNFPQSSRAAYPTAGQVFIQEGEYWHTHTSHSAYLLGEWVISRSLVDEQWLTMTLEEWSLGLCFLPKRMTAPAPCFYWTKVSPELNTFVTIKW